MAIYALPALPRLLLLMALAVLSTAAVALASGRHEVATLQQAPPTRPTVAPTALVVPDVRGQPHVFAKVLLEEAGFAWRLRGAVQGYSSNTVARQFPAPGAEVIDTGQPTIVLELVQSADAGVHGRPENRSAYAGSPAYVVRRELVSPDRFGAAR